MASPGEETGQADADHHRRHKDERALRKQWKRGDRGAGAESRQAPADAEQRGAENHPRFDFLRCRQRELLGENRARAREGEAIAEEGHHDRAPITKIRLGSKVPARSRKFCTFAGLAMPEIEQPKAEDETGKRIDGDAHGQPPTTCRITNTVTKPVDMKIAVATTERNDSREIPHTPWPLVQPPP